MINISFEDYSQINRLDSAYWECADLITDQDIASLFLDDALLQLGSLKLTSNLEIKHFFKDRAQKNLGDLRITRHIASGFTLQVINSNEIRAFSKVVVFSGNGEILPLNMDLPSTIADVEDLFIKNAQGIWHIAKRVISPIFLGSGAPNFAHSKGN